MNLNASRQAPVAVSASTASLQGKDKFSFWNEVICRTVVDLDCRPIAQPDFEASIGGFDAPGLGVYDIHTRPHLVYRTATEISRLDSDALIINYVTAGSLYSEQDNRAVVLRPGDGAVSDAARPYFLRFDKPLGCVSVKVNKRELLNRVSGMENLTALSLAEGSRLNPLVFNYMVNLIRQMPRLEADSAVRAVEVFKELLAASLNEMLRDSPVPMSEYRAACRIRIKAFIEQHLGDPALNPAFVAHAMKLSVRYINKIFEDERSSLGRFIWQRRIERCAAQLRDPAFAHLSVSAIALEQGFNDLSHFSRSFKARFGLAPRDYRASSLA